MPSACRCLAMEGLKGMFCNFGNGESVVERNREQTESEICEQYHFIHGTL